MPAPVWYARAAVSVLAAAGALLCAPAPGYADEVREKQWSLEMLHARDAWRQSTGDGVVVAVLDSGVDADHPDLEGQVLDGYNTVDENTDTRDVDGHGTAVATVIAGRDDDAGVAGLAPDAAILPVRVGGERMYDHDVAEGIRWAVDHDASVINMSLGSARSSPEMTEAVEYALEADVVVVAAAGNVNDRGDLPITYPARQAGVVAVTGITPEGKAWHNSARGPRAALCAPASGVIAPYDGGYEHVSGTSFAAPMVAAAVALVRAEWPKMSAPNVINRLLRTADDLGRPGRDSRYGYGRVDLAKALTADVPTVRTNPLTLGPGQEIAVPSPAAPKAAPGSGSVSGSQHTWAMVLLLVLMVLLAAATLMTLLIWRRGPARTLPVAPAPRVPP
ncbi:MAG: type VII secretion-associated serine protease mycosin, partial [Micromonosporaceae bacterium]